MHTATERCMHASLQVCCCCCCWCWTKLLGRWIACTRAWNCFTRNHTQSHTHTHTHTLSHTHAQTQGHGERNPMMKISSYIGLFSSTSSYNTIICNYLLINHLSFSFYIIYFTCNVIAASIDYNDRSTHPRIYTNATCTYIHVCVQYRFISCLSSVKRTFLDN